MIYGLTFFSRGFISLLLSGHAVINDDWMERLEAINLFLAEIEKSTAKIRSKRKEVKENLLDLNGNHENKDAIKCM